MKIGIDIKENELLQQYPNVLNILLKDHATQQNIFWATNNYEDHGAEYKYSSQILAELITGDNGDLIMPRVKKDIILQQSRKRDMAEVFTPSWVCNAQNNLLDNAWFGRQNIFNSEVKLPDGNYTWAINRDNISFPNGKNWRDYVRDRRLEIACGEGPYITSRYDTTTGNFIPIENRIGLLDRKLRVISENVNSSRDWLKATQIAFKCTFAFEWQGDSLLLAREAMLITFIENYSHKFGKEPSIRSIQSIAKIISWNIWQMDGLKGVIPNSCVDKSESITNLFGETESKLVTCEGCQEENILKHNGKYSVIKDWTKRDQESGKMGRKIKFIEVLKRF